MLYTVPAISAMLLAERVAVTTIGLSSLTWLVAVSSACAWSAPLTARLSKVTCMDAERCLMVSPRESASMIAGAGLDRPDDRFAEQDAEH